MKVDENRIVSVIKVMQALTLINDTFTVKDLKDRCSPIGGTLTTVLVKCPQVEKLSNGHYAWIGGDIDSEVVQAIYADYQALRDSYNKKPEVNPDNILDDIYSLNQLTAIAMDLASEIKSLNQAFDMKSSDIVTYLASLKGGDK